MPNDAGDLSFEKTADKHITVTSPQGRTAFIYEPWNTDKKDTVGRIRLVMRASHLQANLTEGELELALDLDQLDEIADHATQISNHIHDYLSKL